MAYTIRILDGGSAFRTRSLLLERLTHSKFKATIEVDDVDLTVRPVRLKTAKEYCGQHPGPCKVTGQPKRKSTCLEWDDWVEFNNLVNDVLDEAKVNAVVFSTPAELLDKGKRMYIRQGTKRRIKYDWQEETVQRFGVSIEARIWNHGSQDQFN